ncbi:MAG: YceI family protein [Bacillota bacterium]|nr:YceI family protein [Bacillota bacterium]
MSVGQAAEETSRSGTVWKVDPVHTTVEFSVRHMMIATVRGQFTQVAGELRGDPDNLPGCQIEGVIQAASVDTREPNRDADLRSANFFDVERYPEIRFESRSITSRGGGDEYEVLGDLTMHGVTHPVTLTLTLEGQIRDPYGHQRVGFTLEGSLNRKDWGLNWNVVLEAGGVMVSDQVKIVVHVEAVRQD